VYSNCKQVELFLNGKSLGKKTINADASPRNWQVSFTPGTLKAVAWNGKSAVTNVLRTAGKPVRIVLATRHETLSPDWDDVAEVRATIVDANGLTIPRANNLISFKIAGPGVIAAVDNADNASEEPFQATSRHAFQGGCVAFIKARAPNGDIALTATATGLKPGRLVLWTSPEVSQ
jgi:beta-galactosidase